MGSGESPFAATFFGSLEIPKTVQIEIDQISRQGGCVRRVGCDLAVVVLGLAHGGAELPEATVERLGLLLGSRGQQLCRHLSLLEHGRGLLGGAHCFALRHVQDLRCRRPGIGHIISGGRGLSHILICLARTR